MDMPFTPEQFFAVFGRYNVALWPAQIALVVLALGIVALIVSGRSSQGRWVSMALALLWTWMAVAYHFTFFTAINRAAWAFGGLFLLAALWFIWMGVARRRLQFEIRHDARSWVAGSLIGFALLIYPALGWLLGHRYPSVPTFGLPCPTTIFTIGVLLLARGDVPRSVYIVPLLWSAIGSTAAFALGVYQDLGLLVAGVIGALGMARWGTDDQKGPLSPGAAPSRSVR